MSRRPRSHRVRLASAVVAVAALTACGGAAPLTEGPAVEYRGARVPVEVGEVTARDVAAAQSAFGFDLLHRVCAKDPGADVLVSPTSAAEALSLLYGAARGQTAQDVGALLRLPAWSPDLVAGIQAHTEALEALRNDGDHDAEDAPDSLAMSNRIWPRSGIVPEQAYLDDVATALGAQVQTLDFGGDPGGSTDTINRSVSDDTDGLIEKLFDPALPGTTTMVLTNAVHLKARWLSPFALTSPTTFATPSGDTTVAMMSGASGTARSADGWLSVELPYRDGTLTAVAILPPEGADPCGVDGAVMEALDAADPGAVDVELPRFELEQTHGLLEVMAAMGLPLDGDYSGLGDGLGEISDVLQKTYIRVDEAGTEAAAATGIVFGVSMPAPRPVVTFDRPFVLVLTDTATRSPLFLSVVNDPS